jgi:Tfp pilus assembly protein PilO
MMNSFSKVQRIQVIGIGAGALLILTLLYLFFIHQGQLDLLEIRQLQAAGRSEQEAARRRIKLRPEFEQELAMAQDRLGEIEKTMAAGDVYLWMVRVLDQSSEKYNVTFNQVEAPQFEPSQFVPRVPYEAARFTVSGRATYHEFGAFLADLENAYPLLRFHRLELEPFVYGRPNPEEVGLLRFQAELTVPVRQREK